MQQIQLPDSLFRDAQRKAAAAGFSTVDAFVADVLTRELVAPADEDHLFTPQVLAEIDRVTASLEAGATVYSDQEVSEHFERKRREWDKKNAG